MSGQLVGALHIVGKPCPVTGERIPGGVTFTDHSLPGLFNACAACSDKGFKSLRELNDERAATAKATRPEWLEIPAFLRREPQP